MSNRLNLAVLGTGEWARTYHLPAIRSLEAGENVRVAGVWNRTMAKAEAAAREFEIPTVYRSLEEAIDDQTVDAFCLLVNPKALPELVTRVLVRDLPIFTEKSPGWTYGEASELAASVTVPNVVAFNRRYMPLSRRFKTLVSDLDGVYFVECHFYRHDRLYKEFMIETGVHGINFMEDLCGPITQVETEAIKNPRNDTYLFVCRVVFASGLTGIMKFFPCSGSSVERYEVHSNTVSAYLFSPQTYSSDYPGRIVVHTGGEESDRISGDPDAGKIVNAGFVNEYLDFFEAVRSNRNGRSNFANAANTMRIAEMIDREPKIEEN